MIILRESLLEKMGVNDMISCVNIIQIPPSLDFLHVFLHGTHHVFLPILNSVYL